MRGPDRHGRLASICECPERAEDGRDTHKQHPRPRARARAGTHAHDARARARTQVIQVRNSTDSYQLLNSVEAHAGFVRSLLVVGEKLFSGGMNRDVKIWDVKTMTLIKTIAEDADTQSFPVSTLVQSGM
jgi:WD40 repeat protein